MRGFRRPRGFNLTTVFALTFCAYPQAANLKVDCSHRREDTFHTIAAALSRLNPIGPNTVTVSGACHENIVILSFDRLSLIADPGASITDASGGTSAVIVIGDSTRITLEGFLVNGGSTGIFCEDFSVCRFKGNTIQGVTGFGGVAVIQSRATFESDLIQDNAGAGVNAIGSTISARGVTLQHNTFQGVNADQGSNLQLTNSQVNNNGRAVNAAGVRVAGHSTAQLANNTITANDSNGVRVFQASVGVFSGGNVITNNGASGVSVEDLSFAQFDSPNAITGNPGFDVACLPQFSATRGVHSNIGGGTTNCVEP